MRIQVLFFGVLKDIVGESLQTLELPEGAQVRDVLGHYTALCPRLAELLPSLAVSVNREYAQLERRLSPEDEVAILPPVSGGSDPRQSPPTNEIVNQPADVRIVHERIQTEQIVERAKQRQDGAVVVFDGIVRNHTKGRPTRYLVYEAYESMAVSQMAELAQRARAQFAISRTVIVHRLGRLEVGETSVLIVVTAPHRAAAFDACRWLIDTLKKTVPIWKKEFFEDGAVWADGEPFPEEIRNSGSANPTHPASK